MTKLRTCIIGCGDIGYAFDRNGTEPGALSHFKAVMDSDSFELIAVCDKNEEVLKEISDRFKMKVFSEADSMLSEIKPDVTVIASSDETHIPFLLRALDFSPKAVFCEKPLGLTYHEIAKVVDAYSSVNVPLQVNYTRRFVDEFRRMGEIVTSGEIGRIFCATFYYSRGLVHNASHYIDLTNMYFGEPEEVVAISSKEGISEHDKTYSFRMRYNNGMEMVFIGLEPTKISFAEIDFIGTEGRIKFNYRNEIEQYRLTANKTFAGYGMYELNDTSAVRFEAALPNAYSNLYNAVSGREELLSPGSESLKIFEIINRIKEQ